MTDEQRNSLLRSISEEWVRLWRGVEALDADALRVTPEGSEWTVGLILSHCARWEEWTHNTIKEHVQDGSAVCAFDLQELNARWASEDKHMRPEDARRWLGEAHQRLVAILEALEAEQWDDVVVGCVQVLTFKHYREHLGPLQPAQS